MKILWSPQSIPSRFLLSLRATSFPSTRTTAHSSNSKPRKIGTRRRRDFLALSRISSSERAGEEENKDDKPGFNPFGFVTDNPSSRSAIQLPESPAEDGNVGQMLYRIEDKEREYGSYVRSGKLRWFVRETEGKKQRYIKRQRYLVHRENCLAQKA